MIYLILPGKDMWLNLTVVRGSLHILTDCAEGNPATFQLMTGIAAIGGILIGMQPLRYFSCRAD